MPHSKTPPNAKTRSLNVRLSDSDFDYLAELGRDATLSGALRLALAKAITFDQITSGATPEEIADNARRWAEGEITPEQAEFLKARAERD